jgi:transcriptional regulator with XRE-family HTH domain
MQMREMIDKRDRADVFRAHLARAMAERQMTQSALARATGADRSTISALLQGGTRLPNAQLAADCAQALGVTCDWLLGLADVPEPLAAQMTRAVQMTAASRALFDPEIFLWHQEAAGYKIRHVPATLPDLLKTEAVARWEYQAALGPDLDQAIAAFQGQMALLSEARSDTEIALSLHELEGFAFGTGYWAGLALAERVAQIDRLATVVEELYPSFRLYLFDARQVFSAPVTVFGPHRAVVYLGRNYIVFQDKALVQSIAHHFDWLLREAPFGARETLGYLRDLRARMG